MFLELVLSTQDPPSTLASIPTRDRPALTLSGGRAEREPVWLLAGAWGGQGRVAAAAKINSLPRERPGAIRRDASHPDCFLHVTDTY